MKTPKFNFGLLCNYAVIDQDGLINILGVFDFLKAKNLNLPCPQMYLVANFTINEPAKYSAKIKLIRDSDQTQLGGIINYEFGDKKIGETIGILAEVSNIKFNSPGKYIFLIYMNSELSAEISFNVRTETNG